MGGVRGGGSKRALGSKRGDTAVAMKVTVRFFGTLSRKFPGYDPVKGLEVEIPDGARVKDLLAHLGIPEVKGGVAAVEGVILRLEDPLKDGVSVHLLQTVYGG